jgi:hypothetical protein
MDLCRVVSTHIPMTGIEAIVRLRQQVASLARNAKSSEVELARARVYDWLMYHSQWILEDPQRAAENQAVREMIIRGEILHSHMISGRHDTLASKLFVYSTRSTMVSRLAGQPENWLKIERKRAGH